MSAPERIFARLDTATVYMDGSSPLVARTREFRDSVEYVRADGNSFDALRDAFLRGASWRKRNGFSEGEAEEYIWKAAAQADYDQRIRSALVSTPAPGLVEALREARKFISAYYEPTIATDRKLLGDIDAALASITETGGAK